MGLAALTWVGLTAGQQLATPTEPALALPVRDGSVRFAVIGDSGTGDDEQYEVAARMIAYRTVFPFEFVIMLGDNLYGGEKPKDYEEKFERPYAPLLEAGVRFYASLGNHDEPNQRFYQPFNMGGRRFYSIAPSAGTVRLFALDTTYMTPAQLEWFDQELGQATERWKIAFFHHPVYSSGRRHGSHYQLRAVLEPLFLQHGVNVVFQGHDHFYERLSPQYGVQYFVSGAAAKLRRGNIRRESSIHGEGFDSDRSFMLIEIAGDELHFQAISRMGETVDSGRIDWAQPRLPTMNDAAKPPGAGADAALQ